jgi:hypothetical protein
VWCGVLPCVRSYHVSCCCATVLHVWLGSAAGTAFHVGPEPLTISPSRPALLDGLLTLVPAAVCQAASANKEHSRSLTWQDAMKAGDTPVPPTEDEVYAGGAGSAEP